MKNTRYFEEQVVRKRPPRRLPRRCGARPEADGGIRRWIEVPDTRDGQTRILRVVTLEDGETIHNACFDRNVVKDTA